MNDIEMSGPCSENCISWWHCSKRSKGADCDDYYAHIVDISELLETAYYKNYSITKWHWKVETNLDTGFDKIFYVAVESKYGVVDTLDKARENGIMRETYEELIEYIDKPKYFMRHPDGRIIPINEDEGNAPTDC